MHSIDHSFLVDEPDSWFRLLFKTEHWDVVYSDNRYDLNEDDIYIEQVLCQYETPWTIQMRWSVNSAEVLSGFRHNASVEPILLEWTNLLANHWACHWMRKSMCPVAPGGLPFRVHKPTKPSDQAAYHLCVDIKHCASGLSGFVEIEWFLPSPSELFVKQDAITWSPETLKFMDMLPLGAVAFNTVGEVIYCNTWLRNKEPHLRVSMLPLPWELVFQEGLLREPWSLYHTYKRAVYAMPWLKHVDTTTELRNGPYIMSLAPTSNGATMQLQPITSDQLEELHHVRRDLITRCLTRDAWLEHLNHMPVHDGWLVLLGIDSFKQINDTLGHRAGDSYLYEVATRIRQFYPSALLGRWDGDEFAIWIQQSNQPDVRNVFHAPFYIDDEPFHGSACVGLVCVTPTSFVQEQLQTVEWALRDAKAQGRGKMVLSSVEQHSAKDVRRQLFYIESKLRQALTLKQFFLLYQPIIRLRDRKIVGVEALIRWRHPDLGVVDPKRFIPAAEQNGTISPMTSWVIESATSLTRKWIDNQQFTLSINLSPSQFYDPLLVEEIQELLTLSAFPPHALKLEITEGVILDNTEKNRDALLRLQDLGVSFAIDDFGTGNSSLAYLKDFTVQQLKIDRSYIHALHHPHYKMLTQSIIDLAHKMGMVVVAEGVENQEQEDILMEFGCDYAQGYKYGRPMDSEQLAELLQGQGEESLKVANII